MVQCLRFMLPMQRVLPGLGAKIPHASRTKKKKKKQKQNKKPNQNTDNRSNIITNPIKTLKMAHIKKKKENLQESCLARLGHMPTLEQSPVQGKSHC